jgi:hypothetical protein
MIPQSPFQTTLLACLLAAIAAWLLAPAPSPPPPPKPSEEAWSLPPADPSKIPESLATLERSHPWGAPPPTPAAKGQEGAGAKPNTANWRIGGLIRKGEEHLAIVEGQASPALILRPGDPLPDGSTLLRQGENFIEVRRDKTTEQIKLYER